MKVLTAEAMREVDRVAIEEIGLPGAVLMENAAIGVADAIGREFAAARSATVFCGPGNNGGDGLAVARQLATRGWAVRAVLAFGEGEPGGDAALQLAVCRNLGLEVEPLGPGTAAVREAAVAAGRLDLVVDALFGTGLSRPLAGRFAELVEALNELETPRLAVDLPSGLMGSRADLPGPALAADVTVAFAAPKIAHVLPPACDRVGRLLVADLGFPAALVEGAEGDLRLLEAEELRPALAPRRPDSHKGDYGHLLLAAGAEGTAGAAILAARAAVRGGAGLVTVAVPAPLLATVEGASLESMTVALPVDADGGLGEAALARLLELAAGKSALAVGPGLGRAASTVATVRRLAERCELPLVVDADGLNALAGAAERLAGRTAATVLTPHPVELARLLESGKAEIVGDRLRAVRAAAAATGAVVALKGHRTLVADPRGGVWVNPTGNPAMATGGTGDVLTGLVGALVAQGHDPATAATLGVWLHGAAGDRAAARHGGAPLAAGDLLEELAGAFGELRAA